MLTDVILSIINFLAYPTWHLVVLYAVLLLFAAWYMIKSWGF